MLLASEVTAAGMIVQYWTTSISVGVWITVVLVGMLLTYHYTKRQNPPQTSSNFWSSYSDPEHCRRLSVW